MSKEKTSKGHFQIKEYCFYHSTLTTFSHRLDVFGPSRTMSFGGYYYALVIVDDYSRFTLTLFLTHKRDAFHAFKKLAKIIQNKKNLNIASIRSDHGGEFQNKYFQLFCDENGIKHNFFAPRTP